jgi:hypothetical protein
MVFVVQGIIDVGKLGVRTRRWLIGLAGTMHIQSFMQTLVVEDCNEVVEARRLLQKVCSRRFGGLFLRVRCMRS